jgi:DNA-binding Xre family transcriptional regulator
MNSLEIQPTLEVLMASQHMKTSQLARSAGISSDVVRKALRGERISLDTAERLAEVLHTHPADIAGLNYTKKG